MPATVWFLGASLATLLVSGVHPFHDSVSELTYDGAQRTVTIYVRAFADDLAIGVAALPPTPALAGQPADSAVARYVRATILLIDTHNHLVPLRWGGLERQDDVVLIRLAADAPAGLRGWRLSHALLCERYTDQVNIVRLADAGHRTDFLFTRGDPPKALR